MFRRKSIPPATRRPRTSFKLAAAMCLGEMLCERPARLEPEGLTDEELLMVAPAGRPVVRSPVDEMPLLVDIRDQRREHFRCLCLYARNRVIHKEVVSIGSLLR